MIARGPGVLREAFERGTGIAGFTTYTLESTRAICDAAEAVSLPVIIQAGASSFKGVGRTLLASSALAMAEASPLPVGVHLDHSSDPAEISACIELGYSSVMVDGSHLAFAENVQFTQMVVEEAHRNGVWVEAELDAIAGDENASGVVTPKTLTSPERAAEFVERTGVDALAVSIGSVHGISSVPVHLDIELLVEIRKVVNVPLVLHGASGIDDEEVRAAVRGGMAKVNFNTELRRAYLDALGRSLDPASDDVVRVQRAAIAVISAVAREKQQLLAGA